MRKLSIGGVILLILAATGIVLGQQGSGTSPATGATYTGTSPIVVSGTAISCPTCGTSTGTVTSVATTSPITGGTFTTSGTIACATCVTSAASLTSNKVVLGGGSQASAVDSNLGSDGSGHYTLATSGAASTSSLLFTGLPENGGTGTTNFPMVLFQPTGTSAVTSWSTGQIYIGFNVSPSACSSMLEGHNGGSLNFRVDCSGGLTTTGITNTGGTSSSKYSTATNCSAAGTAASPSVVSCSGASAGAFSCATNASGATCQVNTTAAATNSDIIITPTASAGTRLGVTCNTTADTPTGPRVASISNGASFTINLGTVSTNPTCYFFTIIN